MQISHRVWAPLSLISCAAPVFAAPARVDSTESVAIPRRSIAAEWELTR